MTVKAGDLVRLVPVAETGEECGEVLEVANGVVTVCVFEEYRQADDADGLVECPLDGVELLDAEDLRDWEG